MVSIRYLKKLFKDDPGILEQNIPEACYEYWWSQIKYYQQSNSTSQKN